MSKEKLRIDKTCLNCRHVVDRRYCPIVVRKTLLALSLSTIYSFTFEDLTHDNAFGKQFESILQACSTNKSLFSGTAVNLFSSI
jgi:hypothetical protein